MPNPEFEPDHNRRTQLEPLPPTCGWRSDRILKALESGSGAVPPSGFRSCSAMCQRCTLRQKAGEDLFDGRVPTLPGRGSCRPSRGPGSASPIFGNSAPLSGRNRGRHRVAQDSLTCWRGVDCSRGNGLGCNSDVTSLNGIRGIGTPEGVPVQSWPAGGQRLAPTVPCTEWLISLDEGGCA